MLLEMDYADWVRATRFGVLNVSLIRFACAESTVQYRLDTPSASPDWWQTHARSFEEKGMRVRLLSVLKLRRFRLLASIAAKYRALAKMRSSRRQSHMSAEEIEGVVRAMTTVVQNLEASAARQSMQEAFMQVRAYANTMRDSVRERWGRAVHKFSPALIQLMRNALDEVMTEVPLIKAYLAECILRAAAQGRTNYEELIASGTDQLQIALSMFTWSSLAQCVEAE
jgi:hypothetical protein